MACRDGKSWPYPSSGGGDCRDREDDQEQNRIERGVRKASRFTRYRHCPGDNNRARGRTDQPVPDGAELVVLQVCEKYPYLEREGHRTRQQEERQQVSGVGLCRGCQFARRYYDAPRSYYEKKLSQTNKIVAIKAMANKLARASYSIGMGGRRHDCSDTGRASRLEQALAHNHC